MQPQITSRTALSMLDVLSYFVMLVDPALAESEVLSINPFKTNSRPLTHELRLAVGIGDVHNHKQDSAVDLPANGSRCAKSQNRGSVMQVEISFLPSPSAETCRRVAAGALLKRRDTLESGAPGRSVLGRYCLTDGIGCKWPTQSCP